MSSPSTTQRPRRRAAGLPVLALCALAALAPVAAGEPLGGHIACSPLAAPACDALDLAGSAGRQALEAYGGALARQAQSSWELACSSGVGEACALALAAMSGACQAAAPAGEPLAGTGMDWVFEGCPTQIPGWLAKLGCGGVFLWEILTTWNPQSAAAEARGCEHDMA